MADSINDFLSSNKRLEREKGVLELKRLIEAGCNESELAGLSATIGHKVTSNDVKWEELHGYLMAACLLVEKEQASDGIKAQLKQSIPSLLEHNESRIRLIAGELIGRLCTVEGIRAYEDVSAVILKGINDNIERDTSTADEDLLHKLNDSLQGPELNDETLRAPSPSAADVFHDTAGWKSLETYMIALQYAVEGCGQSFEPHLTPSLIELLFTSFKHTNRFVRETGYKVLAAIVKCPGLSDQIKELYWVSVAEQLAQGLADNWSQVRMSSSVATREFLSQLGPADNLHTYLPILLPPMCLNRYYIAEGVRLYSQETWRQVTCGNGIQLVEKYIDNVVMFYIQESEAANHAVREASCTCIAELGSKVSPQCLRLYVSRLVEALLVCFKDDSWPVRDAACLACGNFVSCYPEECRDYLTELFPLFVGNLEDSIPSVRQGAAVAIGNLVKTYGHEMMEKVRGLIEERLPMVADQPNTDNGAGASMYSNLESGPAVFGVVKRVHDNDVQSHSDQQMYSCGSLAPKMKRGASGGCMHSDFHKPAQPWEKSEGCIHLLSELSKDQSCHQMVASFLPLLSEATRYKHYIQHVNYFEAIVKQLPVIGKSLGKRLFKQHLALFFDVIFYGMNSDSLQLKVASSSCLKLLTEFIGSNIMRGRIEQYNPSYLLLMDKELPHHP